MIQKIKVSEIRPNPNNPRVIKDDKFKKLLKSITDFPQMLELRPIVVNDDMIVLGGNMRLKALEHLGIEETYIIKAKDLTDKQEQEFIIKDNVGYGEWDWDQLANEWDVEDLDDWGLDLPLDFVKELEAEEDDFAIPEDGIETDIVLGDLFEIGEHRLLCGDSTDSDAVAKLMNGQKADMVFTDPPYGFNYTKKSDGSSIQNDGDEFVDVIRDAISLIQCDTYFICGDAKTARKFLIATEHLGEPKSTIVWVKPIQHRMHRFEPCHELIWYWGDNGNPFYGSNVFEAKREINKTHPTIKPIELIQYCLKSVNKKLVADLFSGSGTTMVAAHQLKRKCFGMELDPKYCQVIIDRMRNLDPTLVIKRNGQII
jgi:DNA modification methylase